MERFLLICFAGAIGTGTRYLVNVWAARSLGSAFPYGTLIVNVTGCFLIALVMHIAARSTFVSETLRLTLATGFVGGLTTYSAFNYETTKLFQGDTSSLALVNFAVTAVGCLVAGLLGLAVARALVGT